MKIGLNVIDWDIKSRVLKNGEGIMEEKEREIDKEIILIKIDKDKWCRKK